MPGAFVYVHVRGEVVLGPEFQQLLCDLLPQAGKKGGGGSEGLKAHTQGRVEQWSVQPSFVELIWCLVILY